MKIFEYKETIIFSVKALFHKSILKLSVISLLLSFVLFRFFDITKIGPIKRFENLPNGIGIMADDIVAGLFSAIIIFIALLWL